MYDVKLCNSKKSSLQSKNLCLIFALGGENL